MAKDGYKRPFRKWLAQTAETPLILAYGVLLGGLSGAGMSIVNDADWDASNVTPEQEVLFTEKLDASFSEMSELTATQDNFSFEQQMASFDKDTKKLEAFNQKQGTLNAEIRNKSNDIANKILNTPAISEENAQRYSEKFNNMGLHAVSDFDFSEQNMRFRNECISNGQPNLCTQTSYVEELKELGTFAGVGGGALFALSLVSFMSRLERDWGNEWSRLDDTPTLMSKIKERSKTRNPSRN